MHRRLKAARKPKPKRRRVVEELEGVQAAGAEDENPAGSEAEAANDAESEGVSAAELAVEDVPWQRIETRWTPKRTKQKTKTSSRPKSMTHRMRDILEGGTNNHVRFQSGQCHEVAMSD